MEANDWLIITCISGTIGAVRASNVMGLRSATCDEPAHPLHYLIELSHAEIEVTLAEFRRVAALMGLDGRIFPESDPNPLSRTLN